MSVICNERIANADMSRPPKREIAIMKRVGLKIAFGLAPHYWWSWPFHRTRVGPWERCRGPQLYLVPRHIRAGLYGRAATGRTAAGNNLETQIRNFRDHSRDNPFSKQYMWGAVAALDPGAVRDLAAYFAAIPAQARQRRRSEPLGQGQGRSTWTGSPRPTSSSCYACHGPNAEGIRDIPRLGGLAYFYVKARLEQWGQGYHSALGTPMPIVARALGPNEIEALASYLSFVK